MFVTPPDENHYPLQHRLFENFMENSSAVETCSAAERQYCVYFADFEEWKTEQRYISHVLQSGLISSFNFVFTLRESK